MPLRQSTISFTQSVRHVPSGSSEMSTSRKRRVANMASATDTDYDTITVDSSSILQLPTPSESATDVSSQGSQSDEGAQLPKSRSKRVSNVHKSSSKEGDVDITESMAEEKQRSISGETLVSQNISQSSLVQKGVDALNLPWNMSDVFTSKDKAKSLDIDEKDETETGSVITVRETTEMEEHKKDDESDESEDEAELAARRAAKKAKMEENAQKWEERRKAAEESATRRSNRASLLGKAGDMISQVANNVLGKRSHEAVEKSNDRLTELRTSTKPQSEAITDNEPISKKPRSEETATQSKKSSTGRREKKWLSHGLYAGQIRTFDARLTESKNKKSKATIPELEKDNKVMPLPMFAGERLLKQGRDFKLPFDVFCPLPAGQPKPDEWRKTNKNVFVGDAAQAWRTSKFVEHSTCLCRPENGCDHNCMNRYMYYECDDKNCNLSDEKCGNRAFDGLRTRVKIGGKYNVGVEVIKTIDRGHGVRSNRTFEPNQIIVEYTGEIITQEECEHRMHTMYKDNECYYLMLFDQNMIIDATRGSIARFVNHSCEPNCRMEKWTVSGKPRMALFAGDRGVMTGEELTYDYNFDPYSQKNVQVCRCGASNCRGILGPKPKEVKQKSPDTENDDKKTASRLAGAKRKVVEILEESTNRLNKKQKTAPAPSAKLVKTHTQSRQANAKSPKKTIVVKKTMARRVSLPKSNAKALGRSDSKLKRLISSARNRSSAAKGKRVVSASSATEALLPRDGAEIAREKVPSRSSSLREKAASIRSNVVRSVRARSKSLNALAMEA